MFKKIRAFFQNKKDKIEETSCSSRANEDASIGWSAQKSEQSSREISGPDSWQTYFANIKNMIKGFSKRMQSIKNNPEEAYLINTEVSLRLLEVLEHIAQISEKNALSLERMAEHIKTPIPKNDGSDKKRRAKEVIAVLERNGALTYNELRIKLKPQISYNRATALVAEMIRDGITLKKQGRPVKVSLEDELAWSN